MMKLKDRDGNGVLGDEDKVYMGNGDPKIIYGLNNSFRYKNFDLNIYFTEKRVESGEPAIMKVGHAWIMVSTFPLTH